MLRRFSGESELSPFKVSFETMAWEQVRPDVRQKIYCEGSRQIRLVEFDTSDGAEHWCETGHIGYVLKGALRISFDGNVISFKAGDGLFIPSGAASKHRSVQISPGTQLLMVEDLV
jgi:quercetin dioxygenase-like cupin family protein